MGYACPVCGNPQADARHLANHLAFTALLGREDHEQWLAEHTPGWANGGEKELANRVTEYAEETTYLRQFEDTTDPSGSDSLSNPEKRSSDQFIDGDQREDHRHTSNSHGHEIADVPRDSTTASVLEEARQLTREMHEEEGTEETQTDSDNASIGGKRTDHHQCTSGDNGE